MRVRTYLRFWIELSWNYFSLFSWVTLNEIDVPSVQTPEQFPAVTEMYYQNKMNSIRLGESFGISSLPGARSQDDFELPLVSQLRRFPAISRLSLDQVAFEPVDVGNL